MTRWKPPKSILFITGWSSRVTPPRGRVEVNGSRCSYFFGEICCCWLLEKNIEKLQFLRNVPEKIEETKKNTKSNFMFLNSELLIIIWLQNVEILQNMEDQTWFNFCHCTPLWGPRRKRGLFATRAPHRPPLGDCDYLLEPTAKALENR